MFLDLVGSTKIAERLGHKTYSRFIRHCFHDLTDIVLRYKAEIYQYVGQGPSHFRFGIVQKRALFLIPAASGGAIPILSPVITT